MWNNDLIINKTAISYRFTGFNNRIPMIKLQIASYFQWYRHKKLLRYC